MLRKIDFVGSKYIEERKIPRQKTFLRRARLKNKTSKNSLVIQEAIIMTLEKVKVSVE